MASTSTAPAEGPPTLPVALINIHQGWSQHNGNGYGFEERFADVFADLDRPPTLVMINEARTWTDNWGYGKFAAARALSRLFGARYGIEIGWLDRSDHPPALAYDTARLEMTAWADARSCTSRPRRNTAEFVVAGSAKSLSGPPDLRVQLHHWHYASGTVRLAEAEVAAAHATQDVPLIVAGDLNSTASGPHMPRKDWSRVPSHKLRHKAHQPAGAGTRWVADTRALDTLIGCWHPATGRREHSPGLHALAEDDWHQRGADPTERLTPTTNTGTDQGGSLLIDWILRNDLVSLVPGTYRVHIPPAVRVHTDHRLITATLRLDGVRP